MAVGLGPNPEGMCLCNCGQRVPLAKHTDARWGLVAGQPVRYIRGHGGTAKRTGPGPNPSGLCMCGCGERTELAPRSTAKGDVVGTPKRYVKGHHPTAHLREYASQRSWPAPNQSGLCLCGCGEATPLATRTSKRDNRVAGQPLSFCPGHHNRDAAKRWQGTRIPPIPVVDGAGCWVWQGSVGSVPGGPPYGQFKVRGRGKMAHRIFYEAVFGEIPERRDLHHECFNTLCVNPAHLRPLSRAEHTRLHRQLDAAA